MALTLRRLGWDEGFSDSFLGFDQTMYIPARVAMQHRTHYILYSEAGELKGEVTGKMEYQASGPKDLPAVGDWVVAHARSHEGAATITDLLPRRTAFSRTVAGRRSEEQVLAANVDVSFIVMGLDGDFNLRRMERYLAVAWKSGSAPVIVLNKSDLSSDPQMALSEVRRIAGEAPVLLMSARMEVGFEGLLGYLPYGRTGVLLGSSGVGKTTIMNVLLQNSSRKTTEVRTGDSRGRHTTSARELILLPHGGLLIDTPGLRELQLPASTEGIEDSFEDIADLARRCRFRDCSHEVEPGCEVRRALDDESLDPGRYDNYRKLLKELAYQNRKHDEAAQRKEKERIKKLMTQYRKRYHKGKDL